MDTVTPPHAVHSGPPRSGSGRVTASPQSMHVPYVAPWRSWWRLSLLIRSSSSMVSLDLRLSVQDGLQLFQRPALCSSRVIAGNPVPAVALRWRLSGTGRARAVLGHGSLRWSGDGPARPVQFSVGAGGRVAPTRLALRCRGGGLVLGGVLRAGILRAREECFATRSSRLFPRSSTCRCARLRRSGGTSSGVGRDSKSCSPWLKGTRRSASPCRRRERYVDSRDFRGVVHPGPDDGVRDEPVVAPGERRDGPERGFEHQLACASVKRRLDGDGAPERSPEEDDVLG